MHLEFGPIGSLMVGGGCSLILNSGPWAPWYLVGGSQSRKRHSTAACGLPVPSNEQAGLVKCGPVRASADKYTVPKVALELEPSLHLAAQPTRQTATYDGFYLTLSLQLCRRSIESLHHLLLAIDLRSTGPALGSLFDTLSSSLPRSLTPDPAIPKSSLLCCISAHLFIASAAMPGKTPKNNGDQPIENGIRSKGDVDTKDSGKAKGKKGAKEAGADEEMTVVVPITKTSKQSSKQPQDDDGDISMGGDDIGDNGEKVDPVAQTVA
ncbi:hypothetical protein E4U53_004595, partial [Claviceps sorghi]